VQCQIRPVGTVECWRPVFGRPYGTLREELWPWPPSSELLGYYRMSLRDKKSVHVMSHVTYETLHQERDTLRTMSSFLNPEP